jgi:hypothetical protein
MEVMTFEKTKSHVRRHRRKYAVGSALWGAASGAYAILPNLSGELNPYVLAVAVTFLAGALALGRRGADT